MPRIALSLQEWQTVARELAADHNVTAPAGLLERVQALLAQAHGGWTDQVYALELDEGSAIAVQAAHRSCTGGDDPAAGQRAATVTEADKIIRDHQRRQ